MRCRYLCRCTTQKLPRLPRKFGATMISVPWFRNRTLANPRRRPVVTMSSMEMEAPVMEISSRITLLSIKSLETLEPHLSLKKLSSGERERERERARCPIQISVSFLLLTLWFTQVWKQPIRATWADWLSCWWHYGIWTSKYLYPFTTRCRGKCEEGFCTLPRQC